MKFVVPMVVCGAFGRGALADGASAPGPRPQEGAGAEHAEAVYDRAIALYEAGDKPAALGAMNEAYRRSRRPELLYNLARLERELQRCPDALEHYRAYVREVPAGAYRDVSYRSIGELEGECGAPRTDPYWTPVRIFGWSAIGAGVGAGVGALLLQLSANADARRERDEARSPTGPWDTTGARFAASAIHEQTAAIVVGVTGGAFAAGGVLCLTLLSSKRREPVPALSITIDRGGSFASYSAEF